MAKVATQFGRIGFAERGQSPQTPLLFLHGVGSDKSVWAGQIDRFGQSRRAIAFDYPGYGDSDPASPDCTRDDYAAALLQAMDALGIERAHLCGLSLGGIVAIAMHDQAPDRFRSLILADSFAVHPDGQAIFDRSLAASQDPGMEELARQRVPLLLAPDCKPAVRDSVIATMARIDPDSYRIGARAVWLADQEERASRIAVPTLILVGALDPVTPPALSQHLAQLIGGATLEIIEGASHIANLDRPAAFDCAIEAFLARVEAAD